MRPDDTLITRLHAAVDDAFEAWQMPRLVALVEQPSHTYARDDVEAAATLLDGYAAEVGLHIERHPDPSARFADHRIYATPATGARRAAALVGHIDTVFPRSTGFLRWQRDGDRGHGPGALDMKSGLIAMLAALRALRAVDPMRHARLALRLVVVSDEEVSSPSSGALWPWLAPLTTHALVLESGRDADRIVVARKGSASYTVTAHGRAAHSGNRHAEGRNAIHALSLLIPRIEALTDYERGLTVSVGLIAGGTARNTVPERASCEVDARFERHADALALDAAMAQLAKLELPGRLADVRVEVSGGIARPPMEATDAMHQLADRYGAHAERAGLGAGLAPLQGGGSDANLIAAAGVPCIDGLGPAGQHYHRTDEWCSLDSLRRRTQALATFLAEEAEAGDGLAKDAD